MATAPRPESDFPTIADLHEALGRLVTDGLGGLPVQVLVVPDSTIQAIGRYAGAKDDRPALMVELNYDEGSGRIPVSVISTDRMQRGGMPSVKAQ